MKKKIMIGKEIICQKSAYLASTPGINLEIAFQKKIAGGFFGGEGFISHPAGRRMADDCHL